MNMFAPNSAKTPAEYIANLEEPRKGQIQKLHDFIKKLIPDEKPHMMSGMIAYGTYHYKSRSGREGDWAIVMLSSRKDYISLYVCAADGKQYVAEKYKQSLPLRGQSKLGKVSVGKNFFKFSANFG